MARDNHYAVVVGIDQYPAFLNGKKNLNCPQNDARAVREWLLRPDGGNLPVGPGPDESPNLTLITRDVPQGRNPPRPVVDEILMAIKDTAVRFHNTYNLLDETAQAEIWNSSRLYLYLSGHGIDASGGDAVLLGANTAEGVLLYLSVQGIVNKFTVAKTFRELVVWTDCCRTASAVQIAPAALDLTPQRYDGPGPVQVFFARASRTQQPAYEPPANKLAEMPNSFFTYALLEGLKGGVVGAAQGIRARNLRPYLEVRVPALSQMYYQVNQAPEIAPDDDIEFVPAVAPTRFPMRLKIRAGSPFALPNSVRVFSNVENPAAAIEHPPSNSGPGFFEFNLPNGLYVVTPDVADPNAPAETFFVRGVTFEKEI
jgi:uncharacterized caspase-like protein